MQVPTGTVKKSNNVGRFQSAQRIARLNVAVCAILTTSGSIFQMVQGYAWWNFLPSLILTLQFFLLHTPFIFHGVPEAVADAWARLGAAWARLAARLRCLSPTAVPPGGADPEPGTPPSQQPADPSDASGPASDQSSGSGCAQTAQPV